MDAVAVGITTRLFVGIDVLLHTLHTGLRGTEARQVGNGTRASRALLRTELPVTAVALGCSLVCFELPNPSGHVVPLTELAVSTTLLNHLGGNFGKFLLDTSSLVVFSRHGCFLELKLFKIDVGLSPHQPITSAVFLSGAVIHQSKTRFVIY